MKSKKTISIIICIALLAIIIIPLAGVGISTLQSLTERKYNDITVGDVYTAFLDEYPNAVLGEGEQDHYLYLEEKGELPYVFSHFDELNSKAQPEFFSISAPNKDSALEALNIIMTCFYNQWNDSDLKNVSLRTINSDWEWYNFYEDLDISYRQNTNGDISIILYVNKRYE